MFMAPLEKKRMITCQESRTFQLSKLSSLTEALNVGMDQGGIRTLAI